MKNYDAKDVSINIGGQEIYGFGDDKYYTKDNSKENQDRLRDNFKYAQSEPIPAAIGRHNGEALNPQLHPLKDLLKQKWEINNISMEYKNEICKVRSWKMATRFARNSKQNYRRDD